MYVCGITPYDATHLGHAATYLAFDLINRIWRDAGHAVHYVQNVTDIDDPLLERADRDHEDWIVLGMRETALFREDMTALRVLPPEDYVGAVESIPRIVAHIEDLLDEGLAYVLDDGTGDIYHDVAQAPGFGGESGYDEATMLRFFAERGGDPDRPGKRQPLDPMLWRGERPGEPSWPGAARHRRAPGLAHRVRHDRAGHHRHGLRRAGRRQRPGLPAPRVLRRPRRGAHRDQALRPGLRARGDDRPRRREDEQEPRQPGLRLPAARRRRRPDGDPAGPAVRPLPHRPRLDGRPAERRRGAAGHLAASRWPWTPGHRPRRCSLGLRERLADDLDSPGAIALVDDWARAPSPAARTPRTRRRGSCATPSTRCWVWRSGTADDRRAVPVHRPGRPGARRRSSSRRRRPGPRPPAAGRVPSRRTRCGPRSSATATGSCTPRRSAGSSTRRRSS